MPAGSVIFDFARGEARLGSITIPASQFDGSGAVQLNGPGGPVLRPLVFGERTRIVARAAVSSQPREEVCFGIVAAATVRPGPAERGVQEIVALALAGAGLEAPAFEAAAMQVGRAGGWKLEEIDAAFATDIDRMAKAAASSEAAGGWRRIVLAREDPEEIKELRAALADSLLRRLDSAAGVAPDPQMQAARRAIDGTARTRLANSLRADGQYLEPEGEPPLRAVMANPEQQREPAVQAPANTAGPSAASRHVEAVSAANKTLTKAMSERAAADRWMGRPDPSEQRRSTRRPRFALLPNWKRSVAGGDPPVQSQAGAQSPHEPSAHASAGTAFESAPRPFGPPERKKVVGVAPATAEFAPAARGDSWQPGPLEWADRIARLLDEEADLRGIDR